MQQLRVVAAAPTRLTQTSLRGVEFSAQRTIGRHGRRRYPAITPRICEPPKRSATCRWIWANEPVGGVVAVHCAGHLDRAAGVADDLDRPALDGPVDDRRGGDLPESARRTGPRRDPMDVPVTDEPRHHARMAVHDVQHRVGEQARRIVAARVDQRVDAVVAGQDRDPLRRVGERQLRRRASRVGRGRCCPGSRQPDGWCRGRSG